MDEHHRIEREADEAFATFRKKWPVDDAGDPTGIELWHHAWRAAVATERERCAKLAEKCSDNGNRAFLIDFADRLRGHRKCAGPACHGCMECDGY